MLITLWSVKGGVGATTTAALLASRSAARGSTTLAVDVTGDLGAVFGIASDTVPGLSDWLSTPAPPPDALGRLEVGVAPGLGLLPAGTDPTATPDPAAVERFVTAHAATGRTVIVDAGVDPSGAASAWEPLRSAAHVSLLVVRPCYLTLRRAARLPSRPHGVVVITEAGRSLRAADAAEVVGAPVVLELAVDPAVARAVDAGLVGRRWPRGLQRALDLTLARVEDPAIAW